MSTLHDDFAATARAERNVEVVWVAFLQYVESVTWRTADSFNDKPGMPPVADDAQARRCVHILLKALARGQAFARTAARTPRRLADIAVLAVRIDAAFDAILDANAVRRAPAAAADQAAADV